MHDYYINVIRVSKNVGVSAPQLASITIINQATSSGLYQAVLLLSKRKKSEGGQHGNYTTHRGSLGEIKYQHHFTKLYVYQIFIVFLQMLFNVHLKNS
jgi:hypothetical protein